MSRVNYLSATEILNVIYDVIVLAVLFLLSVFITKMFRVENLNYVDSSWLVILAMPIWMFFMATMRMYDKLMYFKYEKVIRISVTTSVIIMGTNTMMSIFVKDTLINKDLFVVFSVVTLIGMTFYKVVLKYMTTRQKSLISTKSRIVIVGVPGIAKKFVQYVQSNNLSINIVGYVTIKNTVSRPGITELGTIDKLADIIKENSIDEVIFALPKMYFGEVEKYVLECEEMGITVRMILDIYDLKIAKTYLTNIGTLPMLTFDTVHFSVFQSGVKRLMDIVGAIVGIALTGMVSLFVAAAIKFESPGPVIFAQNRVGLNGRTFCLYKFRSMCNDAEHLKKHLESQNEMSNGLMFKMKDDPRITKIGKLLRKTSLDELPQFFNVLKGDMSLVGTRPPTIDEVEKYQNYQRRRISIKPGLTGLWQVSGRSCITDFDEVVRLDTKYIDEWSLWWDVKIILKTVMVVCGKKSGAC